MSFKIYVPSKIDILDEIIDDIENGLINEFLFWSPIEHYFPGDGHFNDRLNFTTKIIPYEGKDAWIEPALLEINELLKFQTPPAATKDCKQCEYLDKALKLYHPSVSAI